MDSYGCDPGYNSESQCGIGMLKKFPEEVPMVELEVAFADYARSKARRRLLGLPPVEEHKPVWVRRFWTLQRRRSPSRWASGRWTAIAC